MSRWCMYQVINGPLVTQMFDESQIPDGWHDSPDAAEEGGADWNASEMQKEEDAINIRENKIDEAKLKEIHQSLNDRETGLDVISAALDKKEAEQEARDTILDEREVALKLREDALKTVVMADKHPQAEVEKKTSKAKAK